METVFATHLQGLSLNIPAGTSCALVGTSGSGKSTVLRLLFRFYEPDSGALTVAGRDVTDYTMKSLRAKIGEVTQPFTMMLCAQLSPVIRDCARSPCLSRQHLCSCLRGTKADRS